MSAAVFDDPVGLSCPQELPSSALVCFDLDMVSRILKVVLKKVLESPRTSSKGVHGLIALLCSPIALGSGNSP